MILIYNLWGLLIGLAGAAAGIVTFLLTGRFSFAIVIIATVWLAFGFRRRVDPATGLKGPFPSLFFIPLGFLAIPVLALALPVFFIEQVVARRAQLPADPRAALLEADEALLRGAKASGDAKLSRAIREALAEMVIAEAKVEEFAVFTRTSPEAILVLIQAPNLKQFKDPAREQLLNLVEGILMAEDDAQRKYYIGVKGRVAFGAIRVPPDRTEMGAIVAKSLLHPFYDAQIAATRPATSRPATAPTVTHAP